MSILQNLRCEIEIISKEGDAGLEDINQLANSLDLTTSELEEALNLLKQLKIEQARTNNIRKHRKLLVALSRYA